MKWLLLRSFRWFRLLKAEDVEYDYSLKGRQSAVWGLIHVYDVNGIGVITMSTISSQEIISIIKGEIEDYDAHAGQVNETGSVIWVGDGIAIVYGIDHAMYGEIVIFENGVKGMVQDIRKIDRLYPVWKRYRHHRRDKGYQNKEKKSRSSG